MHLRGAIDQENTNLGQNTQKSFFTLSGRTGLEILEKVEKS